MANNSLDEFHVLVGETIMFCQTVEHDIKLIYAIMLKGDIDKNLKNVESWTLGKTINLLQQLDFSDDDHFFSDDDYDLLNEITDKRNHIVHNTYQEFVYDDSNSWDKDFNKQFKELKSFHDEMVNLSDLIEKVRFKALKVYPRN